MPYQIEMLCKPECQIFYGTETIDIYIYVHLYFLILTQIYCYKESCVFFIATMIHYFSPRNNCFKMFWGCYCSSLILYQIFISRNSFFFSCDFTIPRNSEKSMKILAILQCTLKQWQEFENWLTSCQHHVQLKRANISYNF